MTTKSATINKPHRGIAILLILFSLIYFLVPIDKDGPYIGFIDDLFLIIASISYCISQFAISLSVRSRKILIGISITFSVIGILMLSILVATSIVDYLG